MTKKTSDHLVFFLHGMGQQYEEYGRLEHHVLTMQTNTEQILQQQYPDHNIRIQYVAIEWHSVIHELVDTKMEQATLETVPKVRLATNHWLMDCLYYFSEPYGQCIIDTVCQQCNKAYHQHVNEWPDFISNNGQVHMVGFSLGGIIGYDIASMQWNVDQDGPVPWHQDSFLFTKTNHYQRRKPNLQVPILDFPLRSLFTCGSPVAAALVFRGLDYMYYRPPLRTNLFNVFHPFDPLGYRIEPMLNGTYSSMRPVQLSRAQRQRILPKIPNLGIRSSLANAKPFISKARRTFWQYMATISSDSDTEAELDLEIEESDGNDGTTRRSSIKEPSSINPHFISTTTTASPVLSTISATMQQHPRPLQPTLTLIKELHAFTSHHPINNTTSLPMTFVSDSTAESDDNYSDADYMSTLFIDSRDMIDSDDDGASFFTATTFDTIMEMDVEELLPPLCSSTSTSISEGKSESIPDCVYGLTDQQDTTTPLETTGVKDDSTTATSLLATDGLEYPRLDYVLTETVIDTYASEWIVAMKSHFKYWANRDLALHMVNVMVNEKVV